MSHFLCFHNPFKKKFFFFLNLYCMHTWCSWNIIYSIFANIYYYLLLIYEMHQIQMANYVFRMRRLPLIVGNDLQVQRTWRSIFNKFERDALVFFFFFHSLFSTFFFVCKIKSLWFVSPKSCQIVVLFYDCRIFKGGDYFTIKVSDLLACIKKAAYDHDDNVL